MEANRRTATWAGVVLGITVALLLNVVAHADDSDRTVTEELHRTYPLTANGTIKLENINGAAHITAWDQNEVKLDAIKRAFDAEELKTVEIEINDRPDFLSIRTQYHNEQTVYRPDHHGAMVAAVEYTLSVPRNAHLDGITVINGALDVSGSTGEVRASCINGKLAARGLSGSVKLSTVNGLLEASFDHVENSPLELSSVNGRVRLTLPSDANARIDASTVHGSIQNDFGLQADNRGFVGHWLRGELGSGGNPIRVHNVNGPIKIEHAKDGRALSPARSSGQPDI
ncbi:MAG: DUF4097 family beta strand repeat protein [Acidobacteria bacterium]|nr:DUF4097 family beta strand repeat protein [Acidobacteriota bacterium]